MSKTPFEIRLIKILKIMFIFGVIGGAMWLTRNFEYNKLSVAIMYFATAIFVILFFNENKFQYKGVLLYFYVGLMFLFIVLYQDIYLQLGIIDSSTGEFIKDKDDALYFSIVTWTTLGYGDFKPSPASRFYAASQAMLGYIYMSILVAKLFSWMNVITTDNNKENSNK